MVVRGSVAPCHEASVRQGAAATRVRKCHRTRPLRAPTSDRPGDRYTGEAQGPEVPSCRKRGPISPVPRPRLAMPIATRSPVVAARQLLLKKDTRPEVSVDAAADLAPDTEVHVLDPGLPLAI